MERRSESDSKLATRNSAAGDVVQRLMACHNDFLSFLEGRLNSRQDAEDVLQDAFVTAIEHGGELKRGESAVAWFYRLLRRALIDRHRSVSAQRRALDRKEELLAEDEELQTALCRCITPLIATLPAEQATLIRQVDFEGKALKDEAKRLGIGANAAAARIRRARQALLREVQRACRTCAVHGCLDCHC